MVTMVHGIGPQIEQTGLKEFTVHMDTGLPKQQTPNHQSGRLHVFLSHPDYWHYTGVCPQRHLHCPTLAESQLLSTSVTPPVLHPVFWVFSGPAQLEQLN